VFLSDRVAGGFREADGSLVAECMHMVQWPMDVEGASFIDVMCHGAVVPQGSAAFLEWMTVRNGIVVWHRLSILRGRGDVVRGITVLPGVHMVAFVCSKPT
jgi:hypothetical protein